MRRASINEPEMHSAVTLVSDVLPRVVVAPLEPPAIHDLQIGEVNRRALPNSVDVRRLAAAPRLVQRQASAGELVIESWRGPRAASAHTEYNPNCCASAMSAKEHLW